MKIRKMIFLGFMIGYSLVLYVLEIYILNFFIVIFLGVKLGLSNIIILILLMLLGVKDIVIIVIIRVILLLIFVGFLLYLLFSIGGVYLSFLFMYLVSKIKDLLLIGISIIGVIGYNIG